MDCVDSEHGNKHMAELKRHADNNKVFKRINVQHHTFVFFIENTITKQTEKFFTTSSCVVKLTFQASFCVSHLRALGETCYRQKTSTERYDMIVLYANDSVPVATRLRLFWHHGNEPRRHQHCGNPTGSIFHYLLSK